MQDTMSGPHGHYHLHVTDSDCYGDYIDFEYAIQAAAMIQDSWRTPWGVPAILIVDAPCCIQECNDDEHRVCDCGTPFTVRADDPLQTCSHCTRLAFE